MAVQSNGTKYLLAPNTWASVSAPEFTVSFLLRVDALTINYGRAYAFASGLDWCFDVYKDPNDPAGTFVAEAVARDATTGYNEARVHGLPVGAVVHVVISYSGTDPSRCFLDANGRRAVGSEWGTFAGDTQLGAALELFNARYQVDSPFESHLTLEHLLLIDKALTDEEILDLRGDPAATIAGLSSTLKLYYPLTGTVGADVATGDAGITIAGNASRSLELQAGDGTALKYVASIPYTPAVVIDEAYVPTSGEVLIFTLKNAATGDAVSLDPSDVAAMGTLSLSIDGGEPVDLDGPDSDRTQHRPSLGAFCWLLPEGVSIAEGQSVTLSAASGWLMTTGGEMPALVDYPVTNRVGGIGVRPADGQIEPGVNTQSNMATNYSSGRLSANIAKHMEVKTHDVWEDGTPKAPFSLIVMFNNSYNYVDSFGYPADCLVGPWLLVWDNEDLDHPVTDLQIQCVVHGFRLTEVPGYANTIATDAGERRVKVFNFTRHEWSCTLNDAIDAEADTIVLTSAGEVGMGSNPNAPDRILLTIGAEDIYAAEASCVGEVTTLTGCTRGARGTTAASHSSGASATLRTTMDAVQVNLVSNHDASRRFTGLRIYTPGNWPIEVPDEPTPLDVPDEDHYQLDASFKADFVDHGIGVIRNMETAGAMDDYIFEVEDSTLAADFPWNNKHPQNWTFSGVEPFDHTVDGPHYVYFNREEEGAETWTATLAADCNAGDATLRITTSDGSRLVAGTTLFIDDERIRILRPCAVGDDEYPVVRGRFETTPADHTSGATITCGWRKQITDLSQYGLPDASRNDMSLHYYVLVLDEDNSPSPLVSGILTSALDVADVPDDLVIEARRDLTLTADLASSDLVIHAEPDSPPDWDWIAPGGFVTFGGERMLVSGVDSDAGAITVHARTGSTATVSSGSSGTHTANGPRCDGSVTRYVTMFVEGTSTLALSPTKCLVRTSSGYDLPDPGECLKATVSQAFAPGCHRRKTGDPLVARSPSAYFPADFIAKIAAASGKNGKKCNVWLNLPYGCSDDFIYEQARIVRDNTPPGTKARFVNSNEVWNYSINRAYMTQRAFGWVLGLDDTIKHHFLSDFRIAKVARQCYAKDGREDDVVCTIEWHFGNMGKILELLLELESDGYDLSPPLQSICDASYFAPGNQASDADNESLQAIVALASDEAALDIYAYDTEYSPVIVGGRDSALATRDALNTHFGWSVTRDHYEYGIEAMAPQPEPATTGERLDRYKRALDILANPNVYWYELTLDAITRRRYQATSAPTFCLARTAGYTLYDHGQQLWGIKQHLGHRPGRGDGSSGGSDNRQYLFTPGQPNSTALEFDSPSRHTDSVRAAAYQAKAASWFAEAPPTNPFTILADGLHLEWTPGGTIVWVGDGVFRLNVNNAESYVSVMLPPTGSGTGTLTFTLLSPVPPGASVVVEMDGGVATIDGEPSSGLDEGSTAVTNNSEWTPGGDGGDPGGTTWVRRRSAAALTRV